MAVDHNNPQSRTEEILIATIDGEEYDKLPQSRLEELLLELKQVIEAGGGGGGTSNYNNLSNKPQVNGITLSGDKSAADLSLVLAEVGKGLSTNDYSDEEKAKVANLITAIEGILTGSDIDSFGDVETALSVIKDGTEIDSFGDVEVALLDKADTSDLGTAAAKDSTNSVTAGSTDLVESGAVKDAIDAAVSAAYHHAGTKTVAQLTHDLLIAANEGNVYNITDSGTTTSDFIEGIGKQIDAGDNVGICKVGDVYMFDLLSGLEDTSIFVQKSQTAGLLNNDGTVNTTIEGTVAGNTAAIATKQPITDNTLQTVDKTIPGAINEVKSGLTNLSEEVNGDATTYPYADVITIEDAVPSNLADCSVKIEPVQDLHGYDNPWVGGAGKNKLPLVLAEIKSLNTSGTWSENVYTENSVKYTVLLDNDGNVIGVNIDGVASTATGIILAANQTFDTDCLLSKGNSSGVGVVSLALLNNAGTEVAVEATSTGATVEAGNYGNVRIRVNANITVSNVYIYPMIRLATETDATFAPYTNLCPISGHTEVDVQRDGKNLFDKDNINSINKYYDGARWINQASGQWKTIFIPVIAGRTYTSSGFPNTAGAVSVFVKADKSTVLLAFASANNNSTFVVPDTAEYVGFAIWSRDEDYTIAQLELGQTATPYEPYQGNTYTIALGSTIYGGTVDFDSGVMTVTHKYIEFSGGETETWTKRSGTNSYQHTEDLGIIDASSTVTAISNLGRQNFNGAYYGTEFAFGYAESNHVFYVGAPNIENAEDFKTYLSNNYLQVVGILATPFTVQLTPQQIQLLQGQNTLTASTGDISVTVNGVNGSIGAVQEQVNDIAEDVADVQSGLDTVQSGLTTLGTRVNGIYTRTFYNDTTSTTLNNVYLPKTDKHTIVIIAGNDICTLVVSPSAITEQHNINNQITVALNDNNQFVISGCPYYSRPMFIATYDFRQQPS